MDSQGRSLPDMAKYYDEWWENPRDPRGKVFAVLNKTVDQWIPNGHNKRALDLGSGCGAVIKMLVKKDYKVTGVEYGSDAALRLCANFPSATIVQADLNNWNPEQSFDLITIIELIQNLTESEIISLLKKLHSRTNRILLSCPNRQSLQGQWVILRKFKAPFVYLYSIKEFEKMITDAGYTIVRGRGVGFLMPITLLSGFRIQLIPSWIVSVMNRILDPIFPTFCSLYLVELKKI